MRTLVVLALLGSAFASPFLQDTPEVVAERARFMQLFNAQAAAAAAAPDDPAEGARFQQAPASSQWTPPQPQASQWSAQPSLQAPTGRWAGPVATDIPAGLPGSAAQVADTADVAAAREAFLAAYRAQVAATTGRNVAPTHQTFTPTQQHTPHQTPRHQNALPGAPQKWNGPLASTVPAGVDGRITPVADTAEVAAARTAFLNAYNAALSGGRPAAPQPAWAPASQQTFAPAPQPQARWTGPVAATIPAGLPGAGSQVGQTADVAAATAAFQQAYSAAVAATTGRRF